MAGLEATAGAAVPVAGEKAVVLHAAAKDVVRLADAAVVVVVGHGVWRSKSTVASVWTSRLMSKKTLMSTRTTRTNGLKTTIFGE